MAHGLQPFLVPRDQASPSTREARGPLSLAAWNGMEPCGYHRPTLSTIRLPFSGYYYYGILILCAVLMSVPALPHSNQCQVLVQCGKAYEHAKILLTEGSILHDQESLCKAVRTYKHCVSKVGDGCYADLSYHSHRQIASRMMRDANCTSSGDRLDPSDKQPRQPVVPSNENCIYKGSKVFKHCSLFGDPHLRTFREEFQTCRVKGAWPLINNDYLAVQVTNIAVEGNSDATATSKLTVIVKGNSECTTEDYQTYQAQFNSLPSTFEDGRTSYGVDYGLELVEVDPGKHVEIHIRYIETQIIIRQIGRYFTFSIEMPEELVTNNGTGAASSEIIQLCVGGCPAAEQINYREYLATRNRSLSQSTAAVKISSQAWDHAERVCRESNLVDFYYDSCVFDLMTTGDVNFTLSALGALRDMVKLDPMATQMWMNRSRLIDSPDNSGNGNLYPPSLRLHQTVLALFLTSFIITKVLLW